MECSPQKTQRKWSGKLFRLFIFYIQYRWHFISILWIKSTGRKRNCRDKVRIQETQSLLLTGTYQEWSVNLNIIDIYKIFIIIPTPHWILRGHFIHCSHPWHSFNKTFNSTTWNAGNKGCFFRVDTCKSRGSYLPVLHNNVRKDCCWNSHDQVDFFALSRIQD